MYKSHGNFIISIDDRILKVDAQGPFNSEAVATYKQDLLLSIEHIAGAWDQLNFMHENCLYTPQSKVEMEKLTKLRKERHLAAVAFIFDRCTASITLREQLADIYFQCNVPCQFFEHPAEAIEWLEQSIHNHNSVNHLNSSLSASSQAG